MTVVEWILLIVLVFPLWVGAIGCLFATANLISSLARWIDRRLT